MGASGSMNYTVPSGSFYSPGDMLLYNKKDPHTAFGQARAELITPPELPSPQYEAVTAGVPFGMATRKNFQDFKGASTTTTITESLTIKYFQRVFDAGLSVYCYYTKTNIDASPLSTETIPEYTGAISDHSVVKILEIY